jgi:hypothetical protein
MNSEPILPIIVTTRYSSATYMARSEGLTASCTESAQMAALAVASKVFTRNLGRKVPTEAITAKQTSGQNSNMEQAMWSCSIK